MFTKTKLISAFAAQSARSELTAWRYEQPLLGDFDVEIAITHCGICHSDLHLIDHDWDIAHYPLVAGHEIIGTVPQKGKYVADVEIGGRVGVGWQCASCHHCTWCNAGEENLCLSQKATCVDGPGGFATTIVVDHRFVFPIPHNLKSQTAAPLLCGGATVFSPLLEQGIDATARIAIFGIGGLGHLALQFAHALGCEIFAFSSSAHKEKEAKEFGATHYINTQNTASINKLHNAFDLILYTSSSATDFAPLLDLLQPKGKLCLLGAPKNGRIEVPIFSLISGRKSVLGSNIASPALIQKMLDFAARHGIQAKTELFPMNQINVALAKLRANQIHYRAVLVN